MSVDEARLKELALSAKRLDEKHSDLCRRYGQDGSFVTEQERMEAAYDWSHEAAEVLEQMSETVLALLEENERLRQSREMTISSFEATGETELEK